MNLLRKMLPGFFRPKALSLADSNGWPGIDRDLPEAVTASSTLSLSAAWGCLNLLVGTQASLPLMVYRTDSGGGRDVARDHDLYRILHDSPNDEQTPVDFFEFGCLALELRGSAFAEKNLIGSRLVGLTPIHPDAMSVRRLSSGGLEYSWTQDGVSRRETADRILHIRGFGGSPLGGLSTLTHARNTLGLASAINRAALRTFVNGLRPSGVLTFEKFLTPEQRKDTHDLLVEKFMGAMNAGRPMVLEGGSTWSAIDFNPEDAQMLQSRAFSVEEICRFFGVPPFMVGHTEKTTSWGTGLEQQILGFQKFTLRRRLRRIEQALMKQLLMPQDRAAGIVIEFNLEGLLAGDSKARSEFYKAALGDTQRPGWMIRNEVRRLENLPPIAGWDEPIPLITAATGPGAGRNGGSPLENDDAENA